MELILDTEVYKDYYLASFMEVTTQRVINFEMYEDKPFNIKTVFQMLQTCKIITFNGINYDIPLLSAVLCGATCQEIKDYSDKIIVGKQKHWQLGLRSVDCDHIDLIEVAPGVGTGLKAYGGRMHCKKMQDLPIEPSASMSVQDREDLKEYCANDLQTTLELYMRLIKQVALRETMGAQYGTDLRSKSDAQIAETVIKLDVSGLMKAPVGKPVVGEKYFTYDVPVFLRDGWITTLGEDLIWRMSEASFTLKDTGNVEMPPNILNNIKIGNSRYTVGIGGLHSNEKKISHVEDDHYVLSDHDVASYYPSIILNCGLAPEHMGKHFSAAYKKIYDDRLAAKKAGDMVTADTLKIVLNGSFGKFGSKYSSLYSPKLLIQTTVTGQLCLLMLIDMLKEVDGISVVSANTDGIVVKCKRSMVDTRDFLIKKWEEITGFNTEQNNYKALYSKDVNNYIAIKDDGSVKTKGLYAIGGLMKNPTNTVCVEAVIKLLTAGVPIEDTINNETDIRKFVTVRKVNGGALDHAGVYLGKTIRWYYSVVVDTLSKLSPEHGHIKYKTNGNKVPKSDGALALMQLSDEIPEDINRQWYINEANAILKVIGV